MKLKSLFDCYEITFTDRKYIMTGTLEEIAETTGLSLITVKNYAYSAGGHRYDIVRNHNLELQGASNE